MRDALRPSGFLYVHAFDAARPDLRNHLKRVINGLVCLECEHYNASVLCEDRARCCDGPPLFSEWDPHLTRHLLDKPFPMCLMLGRHAAVQGLRCDVIDWRADRNGGI